MMATQKNDIRKILEKVNGMKISGSSEKCGQNILDSVQARNDSVQIGRDSVPGRNDSVQNPGLIVADSQLLWTNNSSIPPEKCAQVPQNLDPKTQNLPPPPNADPPYLKFLSTKKTLRSETTVLDDEIRQKTNSLKSQLLLANQNVPNPGIQISSSCGDEFVNDFPRSDPILGQHNFPNDDGPEVITLDSDLEPDDSPQSDYDDDLILSQLENLRAIENDTPIGFCIPSSEDQKDLLDNEDAIIPTTENGSNCSNLLSNDFVAVEDINNNGKGTVSEQPNVVVVNETTNIGNTEMPRTLSKSVTVENSNSNESNGKSLLIDQNQKDATNTLESTTKTKESKSSGSNQSFDDDDPEEIVAMTTEPPSSALSESAVNSPSKLANSPKFTAPNQKSPSKRMNLENLPSRKPSKVAKLSLNPETMDTAQDVGTPISVRNESFESNNSEDSGISSSASTPIIPNVKKSSQIQICETDSDCEIMVVYDSSEAKKSEKSLPKDSTSAANCSETIVVESQVSEENGQSPINSDNEMVVESLNCLSNSSDANTVDETNPIPTTNPNVDFFTRMLDVLVTPTMRNLVETLESSAPNMEALEKTAAVLDDHDRPTTAFVSEESIESPASSKDQFINLPEVLSSTDPSTNPSTFPTTTNQINLPMRFYRPPESKDYSINREMRTTLTEMREKLGRINLNGSLENEDLHVFCD
uniref:WH2 domain-containing protein n=1 Tax=Panagrolaimus sp. JU765 TaxID=591449 RepID=A0AC34Q2W4_9BILA